MLMNIAKLENYLQIDSSRYNRPSIEALNYYATRFMLTVPFENIDVQNSKPISINIDALFNKIVHDKRGGFCYELNTFFKAYLQQKGFNPELMSATIHTPGGGRSLNGSHASLVVSINDVFYVTDVALETYLYMPFLLLHLSIHNQLLISVVHSALFLTTKTRIFSMFKNSKMIIGIQNMKLNSNLNK